MKAKLDSVHLLVGKKSVQFAAEVETFEPAEEFEEEDVNYINGAGFQGQRYNNQQGNRGFSGNMQRNNFTGNQSSTGYTPKPQFQKDEYQKPYQNNNFSRNYGS